MTPAPALDLTTSLRGDLEVFCFKSDGHRFMGCSIPQCGRFESFHVSRVPNPGTLVVPTTSTSSVTLWLCVIVCLAATCGTT